MMHAKRTKRSTEGALRSLLGGERGDTLVIAAISMVVLLSFLGLSVDMAQLWSAHRRLQTVADAASMAAGLELRVCGTLTNCSAMQTAVQGALAENGVTGATLVQNCGSVAVTGTTVSINTPPCAQGANDPNTGKRNVVEITASVQQKTWFAGLLGLSSVPLSARAETMRGGGPCIYALDPSGPNALTVDSAAVVTSACGMVIESQSPAALSCLVLAAVWAPTIKLTGGVAQLLCGVSPTLRTNTPAPSPADPLAYLPTPPVPGCGTTSGSPFHGSSGQLNLAFGNYVLYPDGAYCGGINIGLGANVTFMPGTYVIQSTNSGPLGLLHQGGLNIYLGSTVTGTNVTFYNQGPVGGVVFTNINPLGLLGQGVQLSAPTSGTYSGVLFFQDPSDTDAALLLGSSSLNTKLEGAYYFPTASVAFVADGLAAYNILVAKDIEFLALTLGYTGGKSVFHNDYSSLANGSPINGDAVVMVQ